MALAECALLTPLTSRVRHVAMLVIKEAVEGTRGLRRDSRLTVYSARNGSGRLCRCLPVVFILTCKVYYVDYGFVRMTAIHRP